MICVSVGEPTVKACLEALRGAPLAEVRLDRVRAPEPGLEALFAGPGRRIATCRSGRFPEARREALLLGALRAGAACVDLEIEAPATLRRRVVREARRLGREVIVSFHDFERTPARAELERMVRRLFACGADYAKVACVVRGPEDAARLLGLLGSGEPIVVAGMGPRGRLVRAAAELLGCPFTYAVPDHGRLTAPGQPRAGELRRAISALRRATGEEG